MNEYEQKQEARRQRYLELADKFEKEAEQTMDSAHRMANAIPFVVTENVAFPDEPWESWTIFEEEYKKKDLSKAIDVFRRELLNAQSIILVAESRAKLIPTGKAAFECSFCGWVTDSLADDTMCLGCGKRFWSEKMWKNQGSDAHQ